MNVQANVRMCCSYVLKETFSYIVFPISLLFVRELPTLLVIRDKTDILNKVEPETQHKRVSIKSSIR